ncbi:MAG TPA: alpha/beta hydrolase [Gemmataceae bacterium]|nr:alpha/beta hydrolase [Gemmataceae bacterium]
MSVAAGLPPCLTAPRPAPLTLAEAQQRFDREATQGVLDTGRYRCRYAVWGDGPPLLFVPGLSDRGDVFVLLTALLSRDFRCITYDLPLGGADRARLHRTTHASLVADALALLDYLRVRQSYLYGASFGSTVALRLLHDHPERFPRGVLQGGFARRPLAPAEWLLARAARHWLGTINRLPLFQTLQRHAHFGPFASRPPDVWRYYLDDDRPIAAVATHALLLHATDLRPILRDVRQPVLLVCGDCDPLVSRSCEEVLLEGLPNAGRVEIGGCGHLPYLTHPEALAEVVRQFLTPPALASGGRQLPGCDFSPEG